MFADSYIYIYSRLAEDEELKDIVEIFVEEIPSRIDTLTTQFRRADWEGLRQTAHQLKGAAGSYGFDVISPAAGRLEAAIQDRKPEQEIGAALDRLVDLCSLIRPGTPHDAQLTSGLVGG